ncbi:MAG TPA: DUF4118 domain-containing protein, partial [Armatimonadota bacterium]|nr:DUF4118 domain-containing protein [Armatimonadota bacterium]
MPLSPLQRSFFLRYGAAIVISVLAVVLRLSLLGPLGGRNPFLFFYPAIMVSSWYGGFGPGLLATTLTCLASIYYLMEPVYHFSVATPEDALALCVFVGMGLLMSALSEAVHAARRRAEKVEATLRESEEQLRRQARALAAADERKNEFLAMLAHELRNPLAPILNAVEIMRARPNRERGERVREVIDRQVRHMARLLDDLLDVSRITRGKIELRKEPAALDEIVAQAVEMSRPLIESRRHELLISLPPEPVRWTADPVRMTQVLSNLLNNAAKYTEPGGR